MIENTRFLHEAYTAWCDDPDDPHTLENLIKQAVLFRHRTRTIPAETRGVLDILHAALLEYQQKSDKQMIITLPSATRGARVQYHRRGTYPVFATAEAATAITSVLPGTADKGVSRLNYITYRPGTRRGITERTQQEANVLIVRQSSDMMKGLVSSYTLLEPDLF